ncbi:MAG: protein translocase subunit SecF [Acidobacteria bacterium]|nr:protein translocase subunit SecF [Acidobacteriota bacterium]MYF13714.1 protein translocase subunit SecF [Acidobacteriota bacterium]MYI96394.1 protein translocase subunit SecF [Acidobacteriota bacterium]
MDILGDTRIDWIKYRWWFAGISLTLLVAGVFDVIRKDGLRYGIDFSEGTMVVAKFAETPEIDEVRAVVNDLGYGSAVIQSYDRPEMNQVMIRVEKAEDETAGAAGQQPTEAGIDETANRILAALRGGAAGELVSSSTEIVGPVVGEELRRRARNATLMALFAMLIYIGFRFEPVYGVGATVAVIHDVLVTLALVSLFNYEISLNVIAAFMTLVGYSVNDTIVIFDRVRENRHIHRRLDLGAIVNLSINQTLRRTVLTSGLTLLAVGALLTWGGEVLRAFSFVLVAGVFVGTYSSIAIASPIVLWWRSVRGGTAATAEQQRPQAPPVRV